jgi:hypothetical protein
MEGRDDREVDSTPPIMKSYDRRQMQITGLLIPSQEQYDAKIQVTIVLADYGMYVRLIKKLKERRPRIRLQAERFDQLIAKRNQTTRSVRRLGKSGVRTGDCRRIRHT